MERQEDRTHTTVARAPVSPQPSDALLLAPAMPRPSRNPISQLGAAIREMRIRQWTKNGLVILAMVFAGTLTNVPTIVRVVMAFFAFSLAASAIYIVNDLADVEKDRLHPKKRHRPIASGALSIPGAIIAAVLCAAGSAVLCAILLLTPFVGAADGGVDPFARYGGGGLLFTLALGVYVAQNVLYSLWLKHLVLWDVFSIALGFVLRAVAGAFAADVYISPWFYLCTVFLSLFLALAKRRAELARATETGGQVASTRRILQSYSLQLLDQLLTIAVTCAIVSYGLYTFLGVPHTHMLMLTVPLVLFGSARYLYLIYVKSEGEEPDRLLLEDRQILGVTASCIILVAIVLYASRIASWINLVLPLWHGFHI